jgi:hypothetical protein
MENGQEKIDLTKASVAAQAYARFHAAAEKIVLESRYLWNTNLTVG